jgi:HPt (histidine-containing phosphotransfer) domain-containing protein
MSTLIVELSYLSILMLTETFAPDPFSGRNEAICRLGGLEDLYIKSVKRFQTNYQDSHAVLSGLVNQKRYEEAKAYTHSLKGLAATLGMQNFCSCCQAIELAIKEGHYGDLPYLLRSYENCLFQVIQSRVDHSSSCVGTGFSGLK